MKRKFYFSFLAFALALAATVAFVIGSSAGRAAAPNSALAALPASDFVISIDVQRALSETLPSLLSSNPTLLSKLNAHLEEFQQKTGINPRVFETVAIGGNLNPRDPLSRRDPNAVVIARGSFKADELLDSAFTAAKKESEFEKEEQQYEGKTIFLIGNVRKLKTADDKDSAPAVQGQTQYDAKVRSSSDKFAVAAVDANTIAIGSPESVRAAIDASMGRNRVDDELVRLASQSPNAVVGFSGRIPAKDAEKQTSDNPIARYFASIRQFYGSFSANASEAESFLAVRTETAEQAHDISQALSSLKSLVSIGFAQSMHATTTQAASLADLLKGVTISSQGNEVQINAKFQPSSLAPLIHHF